MRALLALATAAFITVLTEALPAGVLPAMSTDLGVGESAMGQAVTVYAAGTALAAIPLSAATASWRRKRLLLTAVTCFALANSVTALSSLYALTMAARFAAGVAAGIVWALLAGYARRMAPVHLQGRAMAIVMAGIPAALSLGVPAGTFAGETLGWRVPFAAMTALAAVLVVWVVTAVPDQPGQPRRERPSARATLAVPGVASVLAVTGLFILAHTVLYTYVAPFLARVGMGGSVDLVLLAFGGASIASIWIVGAHVDRRLRRLTITSTVLFGAAASLLALLAGSPALVYLAALLWGLGFGGIPTLLQTAVGDAGGAAADTAQAMLVTLWNSAMAGGAIAGALLLDRLGSGSLPWAALALLAPVLALVLGARVHGFPAAREAAGYMPAS